MPSLTSTTGLAGSNLTPAQQLAVATAIKKLRFNEQLSHLQYWGQVQGIHADYLILISAVVQPDAQQKITTTQPITQFSYTYYWSIDQGLTFAKLTTPVDSHVQQYAPTITTMFEGVPMKSYRIDGKTEEEIAAEEEEQQEEEADEANRKPKARQLTEMERLAYTLQDITAQTRIAPLGYYHLTPAGVVERNHYFKGLDVTSISKLSSYVLLRPPQYSATAARIRKGNGIHNNVEFLDTLQQVVTHQTENKKNFWCLQPTVDQCTVILRNLQYPGYEFTVEVNADGESDSVYGAGGVGVYVGNGLKNQDIYFML